MQNLSKKSWLVFWWIVDSGNNSLLQSRNLQWAWREIAFPRIEKAKNSVFTWNRSWKVALRFIGDQEYQNRAICLHDQGKILIPYGLCAQCNLPKILIFCLVAYFVQTPFLILESNIPDLVHSVSSGGWGLHLLLQ